MAKQGRRFITNSILAVLLFATGYMGGQYRTVNRFKGDLQEQHNTHMSEIAQLVEQLEPKAKYDLATVLPQELQARFNSYFAAAFPQEKPRTQDRTIEELVGDYAKVSFYHETNTSIDAPERIEALQAYHTLFEQEVIRNLSKLDRLNMECDVKEETLSLFGRSSLEVFRRYEDRIKILNLELTLTRLRYGSDHTQNQMSYE